ncbi:rhomboid family intramembrane serine protease [Croceiramulus getboli]|nr:rhomboid family intramembrane serine protease [Flavobacteriaceae bacterium YJPT1-3]
MRTKPDIRFTPEAILFPVVLLLLLWLVLWYELRFGHNLSRYGVLPRQWTGLRGILFGPLLHSGLPHLWHNTIPVLVLSMALIYFYRRISWSVFIWIWLGAGVGTWLIGRSSYHIGMSGVIYGLVAFLFFKGIFARYYRLVALSLIVVFLYGSLIWGTLPLKDGISWEGHLSGFVVGFILALCFRESIPKPKLYIWQREDYNPEEDAFMRQFDEDGNFIETVREESQWVEDHTLGKTLPNDLIEKRPTGDRDVE